MKPACYALQSTLPPRHTRLPACLLLVALIGLLSACGGNPEADAGAVEDLVRREVEAINAEDLQALAQIWSETPEILLFDVPPPGRFRGWDQVARVFKGFFDRFSEIRLSVDEVQVGVEGSLAYASYDWVLTGMMGEAAVRDRGQATAIYRREESGWRLVHAHYSPVPAAVALEAGEPPAEGDTPGRATTGGRQGRPAG